MDKGKINFTSLNIVKLPNWMQIIAILVVLFISLIIIFLSFTPWQQTSKGDGRVLAIDPNDRVQNINSPVYGRVKKWNVQEGQEVNKGDIIVELEDIDPQFIERLKSERDAAYKKLEVSKIAAETALLNYERQKELYDKGLSSRLKYEKAKITYKKLLSEEASAAAKLASAEVKLSRQLTQQVTAPRDGTILRVLHGSGNVIVNEGDLLAIFVPETQNQAAEIYIDGNDLPLVHKGRKVRLQFEGWPAVQFSGWPSVAIGTFGGIVNMVDASSTENGKFRVLITPDDKEPWPNTQFLRQGTRVHGWILLDTVRLGYEIWRKFNGFPPSMESAPQSGLYPSVGTDKNTKKNKKNKDKK